MINPSIKLITIVGPTAAGKTALAIELAQEFNGEIVCADSRTIYRGMDIGTAKPTALEQAAVPHHLIDVVDPGEALSVAAFKALAEATISDIWARGKIPFLVGGSGLYIDSVLFDYQFPEEADKVRREQLEAMTTEELQELLAAEDPAAFAAVDHANRRRLIRAIETAGQDRSRSTELAGDFLVLGKTMSKEIIQERIAKRIDTMIAQGFLDEVRYLGETYGWNNEAMSGIGYRAFHEVILGTKTLAQARQDFERGDLLLYKKQLTWFRRNPAIHWLDDVVQASELVRDFLAFTKGD